MYAKARHATAPNEGEVKNSTCSKVLGVVLCSFQISSSRSCVWTNKKDSTLDVRRMHEGRNAFPGFLHVKRYPKNSNIRIRTLNVSAMQYLEDRITVVKVVLVPYRVTFVRCIFTLCLLCYLESHLH